jgi:hypothetical protein
LGEGWEKKPLIEILSTNFSSLFATTSGSNPYNPLVCEAVIPNSSVSSQLSIFLLSWEFFSP